MASVALAGSLVPFSDLLSRNHGSPIPHGILTINSPDDNVFLASRILRRNPALLQNPDPGPSRFTSLAWAAVCANEEMFVYLLSCGHDDEYLSRVRR